MIRTFNCGKDAWTYVEEHEFDPRETMFFWQPIRTFGMTIMGQAVYEQVALMNWIFI